MIVPRDAQNGGSGDRLEFLRFIVIDYRVSSKILGWKKVFLIYELLFVECHFLLIILKKTSKKWPKNDKHIFDKVVITPWIICNIVECEKLFVDKIDNNIKNWNISSISWQSWQI